jgi:endonuclease/exonuclease/phosphatase family metal-dependent hydrolase
MPDQIRIVSWNVGRIFRPKGNNRLADADVPRVIRGLRTLAPDVILLQEIESATQLERLLAGLEGYDGQMATECDYDRHVAAFARRTLAPEFEQARLEPTRRGTVLVGFDVGKTRGAALAVHLDVREQDRKRSQVDALMALAKARSEPLVLLGGDFNLDPRWTRLLRTPLDASTYARILEDFIDAGEHGGPTLVRLLRVDHFFVRRPFEKALAMHVARKTRLPFGDHAPIVLDVPA